MAGVLWPKKGVAVIESAVRLVFRAKDRRAFRVETEGETTLAKHFERFEDILVPMGRQLTVEQILTWADAYHATNGRWPIAAPVSIAGVPGESWARIDQALRRRERGLSGYSSLARLLAACRGAGNLTGPPRLRVDHILAWADSYHAAHGRWPIAAPVAVAVAPEESWEAIDQALRQGERGLPAGSSLTRLLAERRGTRNRKGPPPLDQILAWADAFHAAHGRWPIAAPIPVAEAPEESWEKIDQALRRARGRCRWAPRWLACWPNAAVCVSQRGSAGCASTRSCAGPTPSTQQTAGGPLWHPSLWPRLPTSRGTGSTGRSAGVNGDCWGAPR